MCECTCKKETPEALLDKQTVEELLTRITALRAAAHENMKERQTIRQAIDRKLAPAGLCTINIPRYGRPA